MKDSIQVGITFQYTEDYSKNIISFVNNVKTNDGGTHKEKDGDKDFYS